MNLYNKHLPRVNRILGDEEYLKYIHEIEELERDRIFCRHNMEHFLNVARIACLLDHDDSYDASEPVDSPDASKPAGSLDSSKPEDSLDSSKTAGSHETSSRAEIIYAAALLHDIGRGHEYLTGVRHEEESARLASPIIRRAGFNDEEEGLIISAIANHRNKECPEGRLDSIIYRADKLSRPCYYCKASQLCHKTDDKKNLELKI
ncbi:MAG: HD domain-containing protein [Lachnospiraceae bacterium]|nr:HD domain-containing protein [Lachnospiraceae bacterium]